MGALCRDYDSISPVVISAGADKRPVGQNLHPIGALSGTSVPPKERRSPYYVYTHFTQSAPVGSPNATAMATCSSSVTAALVCARSPARPAAAAMRLPAATGLGRAAPEARRASRPCVLVAAKKRNKPSMYAPRFRE